LGDVAGDSPSVMVSWAHRDLGWDDARAEHWKYEVLTLAVVLRALGIEADMDLFHLHERAVDWSRWGPLRIRQADVVLIAASQGWRERWDGTNPTKSGIGAVAEADALLGILGREGKEAFLRKVVVVLLPSMCDEDVIPDRLTGVNRVALREFSEPSLKPLLHLLLEEPVYLRPDLGALSELIPMPTPTAASGPESLAAIDEQIRMLRIAAAELAAASDRQGGRPPHARVSSRVDEQLAELVEERAKRLGGAKRRRWGLGILAAVAVGGGAGMALGSVTGAPQRRAGLATVAQPTVADSARLQVRRPRSTVSLPGLRHVPAVAFTGQRTAASAETSNGATPAASPGSESSAPSTSAGSKKPRGEVTHTASGGGT
jgi:hypothetical protein